MLAPGGRRTHIHSFTHTHTHTNVSENVFSGGRKMKDGREGQGQGLEDEWPGRQQRGQTAASGTAPPRSRWLPNPNPAVLFVVVALPLFVTTRVDG